MFYELTVLPEQKMLTGGLRLPAWLGQGGGSQEGSILSHHLSDSGSHADSGWLALFQGVNGMSVDEKPGSPMYVYESTVHCTNILLGLNDQRKKDILCDVTLIVERKEFRAHRAVLAACSEYFWQALVGQTKNDLVVSLPEEVPYFGLFAWLPIEAC